MAMVEDANAWVMAMYDAVFGAAPSVTRQASVRGEARDIGLAVLTPLGTMAAVCLSRRGASAPTFDVVCETAVELSRTLSTLCDGRIRVLPLARHGGGDISVESSGEGGAVRLVTCATWLSEMGVAPARLGGGWTLQVAVPLPCPAEGGVLRVSGDSPAALVSPTRTVGGLLTVTAQGALFRPSGVTVPAGVASFGARVVRCDHGGWTIEVDACGTVRQGAHSDEVSWVIHGEVVGLRAARRSAVGDETIEVSAAMIEATMATAADDHTMMLRRPAHWKAGETS